MTAEIPCAARPDHAQPDAAAQLALIDLRNRGQFLQVLESLKRSLALSRHRVRCGRRRRRRTAAKAVSTCPMASWPSMTPIAPASTIYSSAATDFTTPDFSRATYQAIA
jgi:hypothetical protein